MNKIKGVNGATAYKHGGIEKHRNGSFTMYATIEPYGILFKQTYFDYGIEEAMDRFHEKLQEETNKYFVGKTE